MSDHFHVNISANSSFLFSIPHYIMTNIIHYTVKKVCFLLINDSANYFILHVAPMYILLHMTISYARYPYEKAMQ